MNSSRLSEREAALFPRLNQHQIDCLRPFGEEKDYADGDRLFVEGIEDDPFFIVLDGLVRITHKVDAEDVLITDHEAGEFTGELAVLTRGANLATGTAVGNVRALRVRVDRFHEAMQPCPDLMRVIVPALAQRRPDVMVMQAQREKLASLGTLAAGLAHELNNPASAAARSASQLHESLRSLRNSAIALCEIGLRPDQLETMKTTVERLTQAPPVQLTPLEHSDRETEIADLLDGMEVEDRWETAAALVDVGLVPDEVRSMIQGLPCSAVRGTLDWISNALSVEELVRSIETSAGRVGDLVKSVKSYAHLDQAPVQEMDLIEGLASTLVMMAHKLKDKDIQAIRQFDDVPTITGYPGELNQVWTNLIDNAIDAMEPGGTLVIRAFASGESAIVQVEDDGKGVPAEIQHRLFDPFFTTKSVGAGTGLGLDVAYRVVVDRHHGEITFESEPGRTVFTVRLPVG